MKAKYQELIIYGALSIVAMCVILVAFYGIRFMNEVATPIKVHEVEPGIFCATMVTADGAAIDCWKEKE